MSIQYVTDDQGKAIAVTVPIEEYRALLQDPRAQAQELERLALAERNRAGIEVLDAWLEEDEQEQRESWEFLKKALDEDRLSDRKLYDTGAA